jgi:DNA-binding protein HU-beta
MTKSDFIAMVAEKASMSKKDAEVALNAVLDSLEEVLIAEDKVRFVGFGSFEVKKRAARTGRNPHTKEIIEIKEANVPVFKPGKTLKEKMNANG